MSEYKINRDSIKHLLETPPCVGVSVNMLPIQTMIDEINQKAEMRIMQTISVHCDPDVLAKTIHKNQELMKELSKIYTKIEDGTLVEMPCKVGDTVYVLTTDSPTGIEETKISQVVVKVKENCKMQYTILAPCVYDDWGKAKWSFCDNNFGETFFLTREEAEKALERGDVNEE